MLVQLDVFDEARRENTQAGAARLAAFAVGTLLASLAVLAMTLALVSSHTALSVSGRGFAG